MMNKIFSPMKKIFLIGFIFLFCGASAQDITGEWNGALEVMGQKLRLVFHIEKGDQGYTGKMDSPDQKAFGIPVTSVTFENLELVVTIAPIMAEYKGKLEDQVFKGTFTQAGMSFPMNLQREAIAPAVLNRPQEPKEPFPYKAEDVNFRNDADQISLAGTLTIPAGEGPFPAVVLISGSGPQNRDEEIFGHKPFKVIADHLAKNGIAALRFDDRGTGDSEGNFTAATSLDFCRDVLAALSYLKTRPEISRQNTGLIGHSEGGMIAPMVAILSEEVAFIVLLAGPGIPGDELLMLQSRLIGKATGLTDEQLNRGSVMNRNIYTLVRDEKDPDQLAVKLTKYLKENIHILKENPGYSGMDENVLAGMLVKQMTQPWMRFFIAHDPAPVLERVKCPVLALNGEKDLQVPPQENLSAIQAAAERGGNSRVTVKELKGLNHLFQECTTGSPAEYQMIEQTFSPEALSEISGWIQSVVNKK